MYLRVIGLANLYACSLGGMAPGVHAALEATLAAGGEEFDVLSAAPAAQLPPGRFRGQRLA